MVSAVLVTVVASLLAWARTHPFISASLYAEDGSVFVNQSLTDGWSVLWTPYAGYQHLIPRLAVGFVVALLPVAWWANALHAMVYLTVGVVAGLVFVLSREVITFWPSRVALGLFTVLTPIAGVEALGSFANLHWFMFYLIPWLFLATPRSTVGAWLLGLVALLATATEPQCAVYLPLVVWQIFHNRKTWPVAAGWLIGILAQGLTSLLAPRPLSPGFPPLASTLEGYVLNAGMSLATSRSEWLGVVLDRTGWWIGFLGVAVILGVAVWGFLWGGLNARVAIVTLLYGSWATWTASFVLGNNRGLYYSEMTQEQLSAPGLVRWGTAASILLIAVVPVAVGVIIQRHPRWWLVGAGALFTILAIMVANLFYDRGTGQWPWSAAVHAAQIQCAAAPDGIAQLITPPGPEWIVRIPCSRLVG